MKNYSFSIFFSSRNWTKESEGKENFSILNFQESVNGVISSNEYVYIKERK